MSKTSCLCAVTTVTFRPCWAVTNGRDRRHAVRTGNWQLTLVNCGNENKSASGRRGGFRLGPGKTRLLDWLPFSGLRNWRIGAVGGLSDGAFFFSWGPARRLASLRHGRHGQVAQTSPTPNCWRCSSCRPSLAKSVGDSVGSDASGQVDRTGYNALGTLVSSGPGPLRPRAKAPNGPLRSGSGESRPVTARQSRGPAGLGGPLDWRRSLFEAVRVGELRLGTLRS